MVSAGVYGLVALIVKLDDIGLHLAGRRLSATRALGRGLVRAMPVILAILENVGMVAMLWVGGGIILHGLDGTPLHVLPETLHHWAETVSSSAVIIWIVNALLAAAVGFLVGLVIAAIMHIIQKPRGKKH
jgi:predicted DNA repair protein MutK